MAAVRRVLFFAMALLLLMPCPARAEAPSQQELAPLAELSGIDVWSMVQALLSGEPLEAGDLLQAAKDTLIASLRSGMTLLTSLLAPVVLLSVARQLVGEDEKKLLAAGYVCYLAAAVTLMRTFHGSAAQALSLVDGVGRWISALFPVLSALLIACGASASAAAYTPLLSLGAGMLSGMIANVSLALCACAAALAVAGTLSERFSLGKLVDLAKSVLYWITGLALTGFLGLVSLQNLLASGQDSAAIRAAKYAVGSLIPGVGGEVADSMNAVSSSAILVKNATGVSGLLALLFVCVRPLASLFAALMVLRLTGALAEPLGAGPVQQLIERFGDVFSMLLVAAASAVVVGVVLVGAVLATGNAAIMPG